ncbi:MAG: hypothetical protein MZV64_43345 [Ignavibacteriales bacterium]|nr:hypothetical protein [Ignavibacteriales bacterium]
MEQADRAIQMKPDYMEALDAQEPPAPAPGRHRDRPGHPAGAHRRGGQAA